MDATYPPSVLTRYWSKVRRGSNTECWEWTGWSQASGHGRFYVSESRPCVQAHVFSLELATGDHPVGMFSCHRCDNPPCVNPRHLYWGTPLQNQSDAWARGRNFRGEDRVESKLMESQVREIRQRVHDGALLRQMADEYGLALSTVSEIVRGVLWAHVGGPIRAKISGRPSRIASAA